MIGHVAIALASELMQELETLNKGSKVILNEDGTKITIYKLEVGDEISVKPSIDSNLLVVFGSHSYKHGQEKGYIEQEDSIELKKENTFFITNIGEGISKLVLFENTIN